MPWVKRELCTGCGTCVEECPVDAISLGKNDLAIINDEECIRCGKCHDVCPEEAVRHDGERMPQMISANLKQTERLLANFKTLPERQAFMGRMIRYFNLQRQVAERTIEQLKAIQSDPPEKRQKS